MKRILSILALVLAGSPVPAADLPPLSDNAYINERLIAAKIGDLIRRTCPDIEARRIFAIREALKLRDYALELGYSMDEIEAFVESDREKQRVTDAASAYLSANGVVEGDASSYCALGRAEIERGSITGTLLRMN